MNNIDTSLFPLHLTDDSIDELATLQSMGELDITDLDTDLLESIINSDNK